MTPSFSVVVPVYNVEPYLRQCIDSILGQSFSDFELILVDDGSPDGCPAICDEYAARDSRITVIHQQNAGLAKARKSGLRRASADYVCFVDSDDWVPPTGWTPYGRRHVPTICRTSSFLSNVVTWASHPTLSSPSLGTTTRRGWRQRSIPICSATGGSNLSAGR